MNSAPESRRPVPSDFLLARGDKLLSDLAQHSSDAQTGMPVSRPAAVNDDRPLPGRLAGRGVTGLLLAAGCIGVAAIAWQSFHANKAKPPQPVLTTALENPEVSAQPGPPTVQADAAKAAPPQPAAPQPVLLAQTAANDVAPTAGALPPDLAQLLQRKDAAKAAPLQPASQAQSAPEGVAPTAAAALPPDLAQVLQTMSRDLAAVGQGIEQLKASQEQMARDNAKIAEQLRASQEQMARIAKASEQNLRPKPSTPQSPKPAR